MLAALIVVVLVAVYGCLVWASDQERVEEKTAADWDRPSDWLGDSPHPFESRREIAPGVSVTARLTIYEETPLLNSLHTRYFVPRTVPRAEKWEDELVLAPFKVRYPLYLDIVYQRTLPGRRIKVQRMLLGWHGFYLKAYCFMRREPRLFRLDSVSSLIDVNGQVFETVDLWVATLPLRDGTAAQPGVAHEVVDALEYGPSLTVLMYMARIDGSFHTLESVMISLIIKHMCHPDRPLTPGESERITQRVLSMNPTADDLETALNELQGAPVEDRAGLLVSLGMLQRADGRCDDREQELLDRVEKLLGQDVTVAMMRGEGGG